MAIILHACGNQGKKQSPMEKSESEAGKNKIENKELVTKTGKIFIVNQSKSLGASLRKIKVETKNFENVNEVFDLGDVDPVEEIFLEDLDKNGFDELYILTRSVGSGSYSSIYGFVSNNDKSVTSLYVPENAENKNQSNDFFAGFRGHNTFSVKNGRLINTFPAYLPNDANSNPSGGKRKVIYALIAGETGWILKPVELLKE